MNKHYTSIEQSKRLLELGLNPKTADMCYMYTKFDGESEPQYFASLSKAKTNDIPCWTANTLLNLMPPYLFEWNRGIDLLIYPHLTKKKGWLVSYTPNNIVDMQKDKFRQICHADTLVEAAYQMIVWLIENNYIKTEQI